MGHRSRCVDHEPNIHAIDVDDPDGTYAPCLHCGAQLIADGPYQVVPEPDVARNAGTKHATVIGDCWSVVTKHTLFAIVPNAKDARRIAGLLNFMHKDA